MDTRLAHMDHASFLAFRAMGHQPMLHYTWVYDRPVDLEALRRLNENMLCGRMGRLVEPSRIWGGRHRWVRAEEGVSIEVEPVPRPREQVQQWSVEVSRRPIDPQYGPPWRFGVLPLEDGGSAVAIVVSHTIVDGAAVVLGISEAVRGVHLDQPYPRRGEVTPGRWRELGDLVGAVPEMIRAMRAVRRQSRAERALPHRASGPLVVSSPTGPGTVVPDRDAAARIVTFVETAAWTACAERLGGTSNVLAVSLAARIGQRLGRLQQDGRVNITIPVSIREGDLDLRGNALSSVVVTLDPDEVTDVLRPARAEIKEALSTQDAHQLPALAALPLARLVPVWLLRRLEHVILGADVNTFGCSNLGTLTEEMWVIDGAPCQYAWGQFNEPGRPASELVRMGGQGFLGVTTAGERIVLNSVAFRLDGDNRDSVLLDVVHAALADLGMTDPLPW